MKHQRAIDDIEKMERRQQILQTTAALFETASFDKLSMLEIARVSGVAKGTVYLYFQSKEELFLALLDEAFGVWFNDLQHSLSTLSEGDPFKRINGFASLLTNSLQRHTLLLRLLPILHTVLEHNIPYLAALEFKQHLRTRLLETGSQIEARFTFLRSGQGAELLLHAYAALIGLQSMAQPSEVVIRVLNEPEMGILVVDENTALQQIMRRLITGLYIENERENE
jgi:AcrR family transcriptional regulator